VKRSTRTSKKAAGGTKKHSDVEPSADESVDKFIEIPKVSHSRRSSIKNSTRAASGQFRDKSVGQRNAARSTAKAASKNADSASDEKESNDLVKVDQVTRFSKQAAAKNAASKITKQNAESEDETKYQLTQTHNTESDAKSTKKGEMLLKETDSKSCRREATASEGSGAIGIATVKKD
jgi:hypothetical protein